MNRSNLTTLCYIEQDSKYLMLHRMKKQQDMNKDKWIGVGGHFEPGESPEECLLREVREETGLELLDYRFRGLVTFIADDCETEYMCLYTSDAFSGQCKECEEGTLEWVEKARLKDLELWEGDYIFLDLLNREVPFFSLKLVYQQNHLTEAVLDGRELEIS